MEIVAVPIVEAAAGEIANDSVSLIKRQIGYLIHYNRNIENLKKELKKLEARNSGVAQLVAAGKRNSHIIAPEVVLWQENVVSSIQIVMEFIDNEIKRNNKCLNGMCPNLKSRYSLSRKATKMATEIVIPLFNEALNFGPISYPGPPTKMGSSFITHGIQDFESRKSIMDGVWEALNDDDLFCISICGMGGVGKTTMVKKLVQRAEEQKLYEIIAMAVVSQKPDLKKIQGEIADRLGLTLCEETLSGRAGKLREQLMKCGKRILLIFDDVWERMDFEAIGVPSALEKVKGYKILLTSRNEAVCKSMESQRNFPIKVLDEGEAWDLFRRQIGIFVDQDLHDTAKEIAAECGRLPIAIVTVAGALKDKQKYDWNDVLRKLKKSNLEGVSGMDKVNFQIELSYNYLKRKEAKSCLLFCSLFPEDYNVPLESLVRYGMGLRLFEGIDDFHQARDRVCALIGELKDSFLLLDGDYDGGDKLVKMHDVIRDVVVSIASKNEHYIVSCDALMKWPDADRCKSSTAISIICNEIEELPVDMECPMLQLLQLDCGSSSGDQINKIFRGMKQLQVLNLGISSLPNSLEFPKNLRTLCLFGSLESGELPKEIGDLISLEILEIGFGYLKELPKEIALLKNLKLLDLKEIRRLDHIPSGVLSKLSKLEELYVTWKFGEWESKGDGEETNTSLRELDSLCLTALQIWVPNFSILPYKSVFRNLIRFKILISECHNYGTDDTCQGNRLHTKGGSVAEIRESEICSLLRKTEDWRLENVVNLKNVYELSEEIQLPRFNSLQSITIRRCEKLEYVFPLSVARGMRQLQEMKIWDCENMEGIFYGEGVDDEEITANEVEFPNLKILDLRGLPKLKGFWVDMKVSLIKKGDSSVGHVNDHSAFIPYDFMEKLLNLELLRIEDCNTLKVMFSFQEHHAAVGVVNSLKELRLDGLTDLTHIWFKVPSEIIGFQSLRYLQVSGCGNLMHIFPPHLPKLLVKLQCMWIHSCEKMEAIVGKEDEKAPESGLDKIEFPLLQVLTLEKLPNLKSFCGGTSAVELQLLESLDIKGCNQMKSFSYGPSSTPKLKEKLIKERSYALEGDFNGNMKKEVKADSMEQPNASSGSPQVISTLFPSASWLRLSNIQDLRLEGYSPLQRAFAPSVAQQLVQLRILQIGYCEKMEYVVGVADGRQEETVFPMLNELLLEHLSELVAFCADGHVSLNCHSLKELRVIRCPKIESIGGASGLLITGRDQQSIEPQNKHLLSSKQVSLIKKGDSSVGHVNDHSAFIPYDFMERLLNLESLWIDNCNTIKVIFSFQEHHAAVGVVNSLKTLSLDGLTDLTHIWFKIPSEIMGFQSLQKLRVYNCGNLIHIFPPHLPKLLVKLQYIEIGSCWKMEAIVGKEDEEAPESVLGKIEFPGLQVLKLVELPKLKSFCGGTSAVELQSLESLEIILCNQMKSFYYGPSNTPKLKEIMIDGTKYAWKETSMEA